MKGGLLCPLPIKLTITKGDIVTGHSVCPFVTTLWALYTEYPLTDLNQTCYTVSIWQGLEAYLFSWSSAKSQGQIWSYNISTVMAL